MSEQESVGRPLVRGIIPLHRQLYAALRSDLELGRWQPDEQLPTENDLAATHGCSLITVRRALTDLAREGRIVRMAGRGTFASRPPVERTLSAITSFTDEMKSRGLDPHNTVIAFDVRPATASAARHLRLEPGTPVIYLERVRSSGDRPMILERVELPAHLFPGLDDYDGATESLYERLSAAYGVELTHGEEFIEPGLPTAHEAALLGQPRTAPVLFLELLCKMPDGTPVEYCRSVVRGDAARYRIEVSRPGQRPVEDTEEERNTP